MKIYDKPQYYDKRSLNLTPNRFIWLRNRRRFWLRQYMKKKGCETCGYNNPIALEFDHINPKEKSFGILSHAAYSPLQKRKGAKELIQEVRKCRVLCRNCHKIKTVKNKETSHTTHFSFQDKVRAWEKRHGIKWIS